MNAHASTRSRSGAESARFIAPAALAVSALMFGGAAFSQSVQPPEQPGGNAERQALADYYRENSMLVDAERFTLELVGDEAQWNGQYMTPEPELATAKAGEFLTIYPRAYLPAEGQTVFQTLANDSLWQALNQIGITLMHPVAFQQAGQVVGRDILDSVDGGFDRIKLVPEPQMGTTEQVQHLVEVARNYGATIAGDIIPLHSGRGFDFRLAEMGVGDYPGIYDMIEIPREHWGLLPPVENEWGYAIITNDMAQPLIDMGLMPGRFNVLLGREESTNWSGWAATGEVLGPDGQTRRWIYAHLFKPEQPAYNWMDPTYTARRIQAGDIAQHIETYGTIINRLDAVPFLALEPQRDGPGTDVFTTPLAINGTDDLAFLHRKLGGWSWVELNVPTQEYQRYMFNGPDIGYDFFTRAQTVHPLITGDARILRVAHRSLLDAGVEYDRLIHALQNHDEIAYQLINLRAQEQVMYGDELIEDTSQLANRIEQQMHQGVAGEAAPYNALYRPAENGVATTYAGFIGPALGINPFQATPEQVETIKDAHVMLAHVSALQPGVFALSQWDLRGALPLDRSKVRELIDEGDVRWLNRGAVDLMGVSSDTVSPAPYGLPEAQTLYPPLPEQLANPDSFASQVAGIISARKRYNVSDATAVAAPDLEPQSVFALLMRLPEEVGGVAVTAANYAQQPATVTVDLSALVQGSGGLHGTPHEIVSGQDMGTLSGTQLTFELGALEGATIAIGATPRTQQQ